MTDQTTRHCIGPCGRTLPVDDFYRQRGGDGFTKRCRECIGAANRARRDAARERDKAAPPPKRCAGPCGRELPADAEHFPLDVIGRVKARCHECALAADLDRAVKRKSRAATVVEPCPTPAPDDAALLAAKGKLDELIAELAELGGGSASPIPFSSREGRLSFIRRRIEIAPPGQAAEAADRARRVMAAADRDVRELTRPPFDVAEVFMDMAAASSDEGVQVLATALRGQGWAP